MNTASRKLFVVVALLVAVVALTSCDDGSAPFTPETGLDNADKSLSSPMSDEQAFILRCDAAADRYTFEEVLEVEIDVVKGGSATGFPPSWGPQYPFTVTIPAGAIDPATVDGPTVTISLKVPVFDTCFVSPDAPLPLEFAPHGLTFDGGLQLQACMHPTLDAGGDAYKLYYVDRDGALPQIEVYDVERPATKSMTDPGRDIDTVIAHFSRWELDDPADTNAIVGG